VSARRGRPDDLGPSVVYRFYDDEDQLVYVGCTNSVERRMAEHFPPRSPAGGWWAEVARVETTTPYPDRRSGTEAESRAILTEGPLYNDLRVVPITHRRMFGPARFPDQRPLIRERVIRRLGEDPGVWAYRRRQEPVRIPYADLTAEILDRTTRYCTHWDLAAWARETGPDPWGKAVELSWAAPDWRSKPRDEYAHADGSWRLP
jgi:hypothetical protein